MATVPVVHESETPPLLIPASPRQGTMHPWLTALWRILPIYIAVHIIFIALTYLAALFRVGEYSDTRLPIASLLHSWFRWDSGHYTYIATNGYTDAWRTAFFPLFPLLEHGVAYLTGNPFVAGLVVSNMAVGVHRIFTKLTQRRGN